jgi:CheY-like chemotaxis protein
MKERLKVMVVDDDSVSLSVAVAVLEDAGYSVQQRESALGTVVAVRREKPDVVLLDLRMPGLNGDTLTGLLLDAKTEHPPIVILHSSTNVPELERSTKICNAAGFIEKTSDKQAFLRSFERIVTRALSDRGRQDRTSPQRK